MFDNKTIIELTEKYEQYMIDTRRYLHEYPEVSTKEFETSKFLQEEMGKLGLPITKVEGTGFFAILDSGKPGKTVGIRTDIDALPMQENIHNLKGERVCMSKNDGVMHACGHDGHMATVLAAAKALVDQKDDLTGRVVFIFEEAEETNDGIKSMVEGLKPIGIDAIYGTHLTSFMKTGEICIDEGPRMAGFIRVEFDIIGQGGHGSRPDLSINPIFGAANVLTGLASAWANQVDVSKTVTLGLTQIHGGSANNIFPNSVFVGGSLRYFDYDEGRRAFEIFKHVATKTAEAHMCTVEFRDTMEILLNPVINDKELSKIARDGARELYNDKVVEDVIWYGSESFSEYSTIAPIVFAFVGTQNEEIGSGAEHHNEHFDLDEESLKYSLGSTLKFVSSLLSK